MGISSLDDWKRRARCAPFALENSVVIENHSACPYAHRLVFLGYELVTRRRANPKIEAMVHMSGVMVLGVLMILVTLHDFHVI
jgi:hypothetical protein